jgi:hypothetical protein
VEAEQPIYGLVTNISSYNPLYVAFHEWINLFRDIFTSNTSLTNRLKYFSKPPGWKPDGTGILSEDIRRKWESENT